VQWSDIDYMDRYRDFTIDNKSWAGLSEFVDEIHNRSMHFVPIIDAGIALADLGDYSTYDEGHKQDIFIKINNPDEEYIGRVWPGDAVFPDFSNPKTSPWWGSELTKF
jgi:alpha-glucosidase (family GH31 glycosyl hydrolase)